MSDDQHPARHLFDGRLHGFVVQKRSPVYPIHLLIDRRRGLPILAIEPAPTTDYDLQRETFEYQQAFAAEVVAERIDMNRYGSPVSQDER